MDGRRRAKRTRTDKIFIVISLLMPLTAVVGILFAHFQMERFEVGILDVCATQQDAYVNLVLDQINLNRDRGEDEIITDILGTLDASTNKYWTFSTEQTMLFVKDVLETNKYKGFTAATYYVSDSAAAFFNQLPLNKVVHGNIEIDGREYVASGTVFEYQGQTYKICLLTNRAVLLDNNRFLGAKTELWMMIYCALGMLVVVPMLLVIEMRRMQARYGQAEQEIQDMNKNLIKMNDRFAHKDLHDTRDNLWKEAAFPKFVQGLRAKGVKQAVFMRIHCPTTDARQQFLSMSRFTLDNRVLRFEAGETDLILLFVEIDYDTAFLSVIPLLSTETVIDKTKIVGGGEGVSVEEAAREMRRETPADRQSGAAYR